MEDEVPNWCRINFIDRLEHLCNLRVATSDQETLDKIYDTMAILIYFIKDEKYDEEPFTLYELLLSEYEAMDFLKDFMPLLDPLASSSKMDTEKRYFYLPRRSDEELYRRVYEFYKNCVDERTFKIFRSYFKRRERFIHTERLGIGKMDPFSIFLPYFNENHIFKKRSDDFNDVIDLAHECGHAIQALANYRVRTDDNTQYDEIVSLFFELLALDYLRGIDRYSSIASNYNRVLFNEMSIVSEGILLDYLITDYWKFISSKGIAGSTKLTMDAFSDLIRNTSFEKTTLKTHLERGFYFPFIYAFSYIIAVELFMIYKRDRKHAMELLWNIIELETDMSKEEYFNCLLEMGIKPNEHLEDYKKHIILPRK